MEEDEIGQWLGVSHSHGNALTYWVIRSDGKVFSRSTVTRVTNLEMKTSEVQQQMTAFDRTLKLKLQDDHYFLDNPLEGKAMDLNVTDLDYIDEFHTVVGSEEIQHPDEFYSDLSYDEPQDDGG